LGPLPIGDGAPVDPSVHAHFFADGSTLEEDQSESVAGITNESIEAGAEPSCGPEVAEAWSNIGPGNSSTDNTGPDPVNSSTGNDAGAA